MGSFTNTWDFKYLVYEYQRLTVWRSSFNSCFFCVFYCLPVIIWNLCIYWLFTYNWFPQSLWFILLLVVCQDPINGKYLVSIIWYHSTIIGWWLSWIAVTLKPERQGTQPGANEDACLHDEDREPKKMIRSSERDFLLQRNCQKFAYSSASPSPTFISLPPLIYLLNIYMHVCWVSSVVISCLWCYGL